MKKPKVRVVFDRRKTAKESGVGSVEIEVYYNRKRKWFSTGIQLPSKNWSVPLCAVVKRVDSIEINREIEAFRQEIEDKTMRTFNMGDFSMDDVCRESTHSFIEFVENRINERTDLAKGTLRHQRSFLGVLKQYGKIQMFSDLTPHAIYRLDAWLHTRGIRTSTIWDYHKRMKAYAHEAEMFGYIDRSPYNGLKFEKGKPAVMRYLTKEEFVKYRDVDLSSSPKLEHARDIWLFMCYTSLSYSDMAKFDYKRDVSFSEGRYVFSDTRVKTEEPYFIVLIEQAMDILRKYDFKLPVMSNAKMNEYTKIAALRAGIEKDVTSHWARHTSAMMALNNGIGLDLVARILGHSDTRTTQVYAHMTTGSVRKAFDEMEDVWK